jgi:pimeloyl-ACP methyl ester carboxylesterase
MKDKIQDEQDIIQRWQLWIKGQQPFLFIAGRVFTSSAISSMAWMRVFEWRDNGAKYHVDDFPLHDGKIYMPSLIIHAKLDPYHPDVQRLLAHVVTERIEEGRI